MSHLQVPKSIAAILLCSTSLLSSQEAQNNQECCYEVCCNCCFTVSASALFWQPHEEGLDYVINNESGTAFANGNASVERINFDWDWGFRIELGYQIPCDRMDLTAIWTRFDGRGSDSSTAALFGGLFQIWTIPGSGLTAAEFAKAKWRSCLNMVDLRMSACFTPCCFLELTPFIALSGVWIDQKFDIDSSGGSSTQISNAIVILDEIKMKNDFWGIGPKAGLETTWCLFCGISFYGNIDAAIFYGRFDLEQSETVQLTGLNTPITYLDINNNKFYLSRVALDINIGLKWECTCFTDCCHFGLWAGWENLYFFGQNQLMRFQTVAFPGINTANQGDLTYQGLTLKASLLF